MHIHFNMGVKRSGRASGMQPTILDILHNCFYWQKLKHPVSWFFLSIFQNFLCIIQIICGGLKTPQLVLKRYSLCPCCPYATFKIPPEILVENLPFSLHPTELPALARGVVPLGIHITTVLSLLLDVGTFFYLISVLIRLDDISQFVLLQHSLHCPPGPSSFHLLCKLHRLLPLLSS